MLSHIIPSFNAGELSQRLSTRVDLEKYGSGCRTLENFVIMPYGGVNRRPGTQYFGPVKDHTRKTRLIGFNFSTTTNFILEFGHEYIRFWSNGVQVMDGASPYEVVAPYEESDLFEIQYVQINDVMYLVHGKYGPRKLSRLADDDWKLETVGWDYPPFRDEGYEDIEDVKIIPTATSGTGITLYAGEEIFTPDNVGSFYQIAHQREKSVASIPLNGAKETKPLAVLGKWEFTTAGTWGDGTVFIEKSRDKLEWDIVRSFYAENNERNISTEGVLDEQMFMRIRYEGAGTTGHAYLEAVDSRISGIVKITAVDSSMVSHNIATAGGAGKTWVISTGVPHGFVANQFVRIEGLTGAGGNPGYSDANGIKQVLEIISDTHFKVEKTVSTITGSYTSGVVSSIPNSIATADVVKELLNTNPTKWWNEGSWSERRGYPRTVCMHEQRLVFAGNKDQAQTVWASTINDFHNFRFSTLDDSAFTFTLASSEQNAINWMVSQQALCIGTSGDEYLMDSANENSAITPASLRVKRQSRYGSKYLQATMVNDVMLFVQRQGRKLREFVYNFEKDGYVAPDLTLLAEHITAGGIVQTAFQQQPDAILWTVTGEGILAGMTYERDQNVVGWHRHTTDGAVESVATIYGDDSADEVWMVVKRTINGETRRYIERLDTNYRVTLDEEAKAEWFYVDCGTSVRSDTPLTSVTGLDHLEGKAVSVLADGAVHPERVVSGGAITLQSPATVAHIGLPYVSVLKPMALEIQMPDGTSQGRRFRVNRVVVRLYKSLGGEIETEPNVWDPIQVRDANDLMDDSPAAFTGDREIMVAGDYRNTADIMIRQRQPLPFTVLALIPKLEVHGD